MSVYRTVIPLVLFLGWLGGGWADALAQERADVERAVVERGKAATVLVDNDATQRLGTAFCVHPSGLFVTNNATVAGVEPGNTVRLIQHSSLDKQQGFEARLIRSDQVNDLAILEAIKPGEFVALKLDSVNDLHETMTTIAFGFPLDDLSGSNRKFPAISVNLGKITSLRQDKDGLKLIQLDSTLSPGSSGGPVLNVQGTVVGIVSHAPPGTDVKSAIPASKVVALLKEPVVTAHIPYLKPDGEKPVKARVTIISLNALQNEHSVELWVRRGNDVPQKFNLTRMDAGQFEGMISLSSDAAKPKSLAVSIQFANGKIEGEIANASLMFQGQALEFTEIDAIEFGEGQTASVTLKNGEKKTGPLADRPVLSVNVGGQPLSIDLSTAKSLSVKPKLNAHQATISYLVIVKSDGKEIYRTAPREIRPDGDSAQDALASAKPSAATEPERTATVPAAEGDAKVSSPDPFLGNAPALAKFKKLPTPGTITDVNLMGSGTVLAITLGNDKKLLLVDLNKSEIAKVLPLANTNSIVTGDAKHLFIGDAARGTIERYDLTTFRREQAVKLPFEGILLSMTAGYASTGPILVRKGMGPDRLSLAVFTLLDPGRLKEVKLDYPNSGHVSSAQDLLHIRAAGNGKVFGMWSSGQSPQGLQTLRLNDSKAQLKYEHVSVGHVVPSMDGMYVLTGLGGALTSELTALSAPGQHVPCLPTSHPRFYLSVPAEGGAQVNLGLEPYLGVKPGIYEMGGTAPLLDLPDLKLGTSKNYTGPPNDFTLDKRVFYLLDRNQLISVPFSNDQVILQEFNFKSALNDANLDYFFITSSPERSFTPGNVYEYQIEVDTNQRQVKYSLTSAPQGMSVSDRGLITWRVPKNLPDDLVQVVVSVTSGDAFQSYDNFTLERKSPRR